jgi:hypothetical protein
MAEEKKDGIFKESIFGIVISRELTRAKALEVRYPPSPRKPGADSIYSTRKFLKIIMAQSPVSTNLWT